jgi:hypothetical protein
VKKKFDVHKFGAALLKPSDLPRKIIADNAREMRQWIGGEIARIGVRPFARLVGCAIGTAHESKMRPVRITLDELVRWGPALGYRIIMSIKQ